MLGCRKLKPTKDKKNRGVQKNISILWRLKQVIFLIPRSET